MTIELILASPAYSTWSMRAWLLLARGGVPFKVRWIDFGATPTPDQINAPPAVTVPVARFPDGAVARDSLTIIEEISTRYPDMNAWPADPAARAEARSLAAEMHAGFHDLRHHCPMDLRRACAAPAPAPEVRRDLDRICLLWRQALTRFGGPWLVGPWSAADAIFAPVAMRVAGYGLPVDGPAAEYVTRQLADPDVQSWQALAARIGVDQGGYHQSLPRVPWPDRVPSAH